MHWRTYIATVLATAILVLAATSLANYSIDVRGIYTQSNELRSYIARYVAALSKSERGLVQYHTSER